MASTTEETFERIVQKLAAIRVATDDSSTSSYRNWQQIPVSGSRPIQQTRRFIVQWFDVTIGNQDRVVLQTEVEADTIDGALRTIMETHEVDEWIAAYDHADIYATEPGQGRVQNLLRY